MINLNLKSKYIIYDAYSNKHSFKCQEKVETERT